VFTEAKKILIVALIALFSVFALYAYIANKNEKIERQEETIEKQREVIAFHAVEMNTTATAHQAIGEIRQIEKEEKENAKTYPNSVGSHRATF